MQTRLQALCALLGVRSRREEAAGSGHGDGDAAVHEVDMFMKALSQE